MQNLGKLLRVKVGITDARFCSERLRNFRLSIFVRKNNTIRACCEPNNYEIYKPRSELGFCKLQ